MVSSSSIYTSSTPSSALCPYRHEFSYLHRHSRAGTLVEPIAKLSHDILWRIFSLNAMPEVPKFAYMFDKIMRHPEFENRLTTARHTSQVCASWRQIILECPSIWGNLIDLDCLQQESDAWRNEVLLRSEGAAHLAIRGKLTLTYDFLAGEYSKKGVNAFLENLLYDHWGRIYWLDIQIDCNVDRCSDRVWANLGRATRKMKFFSVSFRHNLHPVPPSFSLPPSFTLFAHDAPRLTHFHQNHIPIRKLEAFSTLTSLVLDSVSDLSIVLEICSRNHSLQTLSLFFGTHPGGPSTEGHLRHVNLPCLSSLNIVSELRLSMAFLDHVEPGPGCALELTTDSVMGSAPMLFLSPDEFVEVQRIIAKYANNYFSHRSDTSLTIGLYPRSGSIRLVARRFGVYIQAFCVPDPNAQLGPVQVSTLFLGFLRTVDPAYSVKDLTLDVSLPPILDHPTIDFFLTAMPALETLSISTSDLISLLNGIDHRYLFPQLRKLVWPFSYPPRTPPPAEVTALLIPFLTRRRNLGIPIREIDFSEWSPNSLVNDGPMDVGELEEVRGLKVVWNFHQKYTRTKREHVCGTRRRKKLEERLFDDVPEPVEMCESEEES